MKLIMKNNLMSLSVLLLAVFATPSILSAQNEDYEYALEAYERGDDIVARIYFEITLADSSCRHLYSSATYYLAKIHDQRSEFVPFFHYASRFLKDYQFDARATDVFELLMKRLIEKRAYVLAYDYLRTYDYLISDDSFLETLAQGLIEQGMPSMADYVLSLCAESDTVKIMRAFLNDDYQERGRMFQTLEGISQGLYMTENYLMMGDTVGAFLSFRDMTDQEFSGNMLFRYAKIALLLDRDDVDDCIERLRTNSEFANKANLLEAIANCAWRTKIIPQDDEESMLCQNLYALDTIAREAPENVNLDSLLSNTADTLALLKSLNRTYRENYLIDSLYCQQLARQGRYIEAARTISPYLKYCNVQAYVRAILGVRDYTNAAFDRAATNIILSEQKSPFTAYILAECLFALGKEAAEFYNVAMSDTGDSTLYSKALNGFIRDRYKAGDYKKICSADVSALAGDTTLVRIYAYSLARCGRRETADSIFQVCFGGPDPKLIESYGEYLIEQKQYNRAQVFYDSVVQQEITGELDALYYDWALVQFLNEEMDTALQRFRYYTEHFPHGTRIHDAFFKIATLHYLNTDYDSAAFYYGLASKGDSIMLDAFRNQLICYKKDGDWSGVIATGQTLSALVDKNEEADICFEIGYASLRSGKIKQAIDNLLAASRLKPDPRYYYWLAEAYLAKGDFARAFYGYHKIIQRYADDEMWLPTAQYKTGIVLELIGEIGAARAVYKKIVKDKGIGDPIGAEANARLQHIEQ
jgi:TolA-binding protein